MKAIRGKITLLSSLGLCLVVLLLPFSANAESQFSHQYLTLTLPDGWYEGKIPPGSEREVIAVLKTKKIKGASIMVMCYRGGGFMYRGTKTRIRGLKTIAAVYPEGQKMMKKPYKFEADSGRRASVEHWIGNLKVGNLTVTLFTPMAVLKSKHCAALFLGFTASNSAEALTDDFLKILKTAK